MNYDLQASHQIISVLEKSKELTEKIVDESNGIFAHIDGSGTILRANKGLAGLLQKSHEDLLHLPFSTLFSGGAWQEFQHHLQGLVASDSVTKPFQLPINVMDTVRTFIWQINRFDFGENKESYLYTCSGRDVTDLLKAHAKFLSLEKDLEIVQTVQNLFLPSLKEFKTKDLSLAYSCVSAESASGDFVWYDVCPDNALWVFIGDVTGHGIGSAMVTALVAGSIHTVRTFAEQKRFNHSSFLVPIHKTLRRLPLQPYWMTCTLLRFDGATSKVHWWGAAPPIFFHGKKNTKPEARSSTASSPLGADHYNICEGEFEFLPGERIVLVTDGVTEAVSPTGWAWGERRMAEMISAAPPLQSPQQFCEAVKRNIHRWSGGLPLADDATVLVIDRE